MPRIFMDVEPKEFIAKFSKLLHLKLVWGFEIHTGETQLFRITKEASKHLAKELAKELQKEAK